MCEKAAGAHVRLDTPAFALLQSSLGIGLLARTARSIGLISVCSPLRSCLGHISTEGEWSTPYAIVS